MKTLGLTIGLIAAPAMAAAQTTPDTSKTDPVTITAKPPAVTRKIDRTVYDQTNNPQAQAGTAADVLNTVPSVHVSPDGSVAVRGNAAVQVYVNGKPSAEMSGENRAITLQSMPGSDIARVEVITNPSAAMDGNGGAIVNIVLKHDRKRGTTANLIANAGNEGRGNSSLRLSHGGPHLTEAVTLSAREDVLDSIQRDDRRWTDPLSGTSGRNLSALRFPSHRTSHAIRATIDDSLSDHDTAGLELAWSARRSNNRPHEDHRDFDDAGNPVSAYDRYRTGISTGSDGHATLTFEHRGDSDDNDIRLTAGHSVTIADQNRLYLNTYSMPVQPPIEDGVSIKRTTLIDEFSGDMTQPWAGVQLTAGFDWRSDINRFDNIQFARDPVTGAVTISSSLSNSFNAAQRIASAYLTAQAHLGHLIVLAGARAEGIATTAHQVTSARIDRNAVASLSPSLHLAYALPRDRRLTASFSHSQQRPDARDLNPFVTWSDPQNLTSGNPMLKPQAITSWEAGYEHGDDVVTAYYRRSERTITDENLSLADGVVLTTKHNSGSGRSGGVSATRAGKVGDILDYSMTGNVFRAELLADSASGTLRHATTSWTAQGELNYTVTQKDRLNIDAAAQGRSLTAQGTRSGGSTINLSWQHRFSKTLTLTVTAQDIGNGSKVRTVTRTATLYDINDNRTGGRVFFVGVNWKLK